MQVVLQSVNLSSSGRYRCEVSAEAPSFQTVTDHGDMTVVGEFLFDFFILINGIFINIIFPFTLSNIFIENIPICFLIINKILSTETF